MENQDVRFIRVSRSKGIFLISLLITLILLIIFGLMGVHQPHLPFALDSGAFYSVGRSIARGDNPYLVHTIFAYPPNYLLFCRVLSGFSWPTSCMIVAVLNLISLVTIISVISRIILRRTGAKHESRNSLLLQGMVGLVIVANPFALNVMFMGQSSLVVCASVFVVWYVIRYVPGYDMLAGILLGVAAIKPNLVLLVGLWLVLEKRWRVIGAAAATVFLLMLYPVAKFGVVETFGGWRQAMANYQMSPLNAIGEPHLIGVSNVLYVLGLPHANLMIVGVLLTAVLWCFRKRLHDKNILAMLMLLTSLFVYAHDYDLVVLSSVIIPFYFYLPRSRWNLIGAGLLYIMLICPHRFVAALEIPSLVHWRSFLLPVLLYWTFCLSYKRGDKRSLNA